MPAARRYLVSGRVQGVGFRWFAVSRAEEAGLRGWVRNLPDGRVEAHAEGEPPALARFEAALGDGPAGAAVSGLETHDADLDRGAPDGFHIRG